MTESAMQASVDQVAHDEGDAPTPEIEFTARAVPYSSVVGSSITLHDPSGKMVGQLALLNFGGLRPESEYWANRLTRALNNGARAERAIAAFVKRGMIEASADMRQGQVGAVRSKPAIDLRAFVKTLDRRGPGGKDGTAIRREQDTPRS